MSEATQGQEAPSIGLQDLQALLQVVDVAAERGTFKGPELSTVGGLRDKLASFLDFARQTEEAAKAAAEEASAEQAGESVPDAPAVKPARKSRKAAG